VRRLRVPQIPGVDAPLVFAVGVIFFFVALGLSDRAVDLRGQLCLGLVTWVVLALALRSLPAERRLQALLVVAVATCAEVIGSIIWGVYTYRLHNLPLFVPPGHGLVYLAGMRLSESVVLRRHPRALVRFTALFAATWGLAGLVLLPRLDAGGALGVSVFLFFLFRGRAPTIYAGVFVVVAFLELWGTAIGLWQWHAVTPGLGLPMGNPPSGAVSGYVLFDIVAIAVTARIVGHRARRRLRAQPVPDTP
jgi:hypothetical protein